MKRKSASIDVGNLVKPLTSKIAATNQLLLDGYFSVGMGKEIANNKNNSLNAVCNCPN